MISSFPKVGQSPKRQVFLPPGAYARFTNVLLPGAVILPIVITLPECVHWNPKDGPSCMIGSSTR